MTPRKRGCGEPIVLPRKWIRRIAQTITGLRSQKTATTVNLRAKSVRRPQTSQSGIARRAISMMMLKAVIVCHAVNCFQVSTRMANAYIGEEHLPDLCIGFPQASMVLLLYSERPLQ